MYDELVNRLRELHPEEYDDEWEFVYDCQRMTSEAADAIEELQKRVPKRPHGRLIDADALNVYDISPVYGFSVIGVTEEDIIQASTIIPAEEGET